MIEVSQQFLVLEQALAVQAKTQSSMCKMLPYWYQCGGRGLLECPGAWTRNWEHCIKWAVHLAALKSCEGISRYSLPVVPALHSV